MVEELDLEEEEFEGENLVFFDDMRELCVVYFQVVIGSEIV